MNTVGCAAVVPTMYSRYSYIVGTLPTIVNMVGCAAVVPTIYCASIVGRATP